jgi:alanyl-tRNA synthetase
VSPRSLVKEDDCGYVLSVTEKLYYQDPSLLEFDARIEGIGMRDGRCEVILDRTAFYPGGGGQPCDRGTLGGASVRDVEYRDEQIVHVVEPALDAASVATTVHCSVDARRRQDFMAQHTGQHIFSQALLRAGKLETVSVHFGDDDTTIELKADAVDERTLLAAEEIANAVVRENRRVILHEVDPADAGRFPLRRTPPDAGRLRIVEVDSYDWAACGGVHVPSTGEICFVKAVGQERIRGRVRVHVMMGRRALQDYGRKISLVQGLVRELTCGEADVLGRVQELVKSTRETARELKRLQAAQAKTDADEALSGARAMGAALCVRRVFDAAGPDYLKAFAERVIAAPQRVVLAVDRGADGFQWIVAHSLNSPLELSKIVPDLLDLAGAKGGGRGARMQGVGSRNEAIPAFLDAIEGALKEKL